jgi:hypothetical protein
MIINNLGGAYAKEGRIFDVDRPADRGGDFFLFRNTKIKTTRFSGTEIRGTITSI